MTPIGKKYGEDYINNYIKPESEEFNELLDILKDQIMKYKY